MNKPGKGHSKAPGGAQGEWEEPFYTTGDVVHDVIFFIITVAVAFGWLLLMLLIVSFLTLSYLHFEWKYMLLASGVFAVLAGLIYIRKKERFYRGRKHR